MKPLTVGSLFAGIGGFDLGFERAGFRTEWQVEIDPYCRKVLERHFPHAERFADIRDCGKHNLKPVDVMCGGFPCQDVSAANASGEGLDGERSGLWFEYERIIGELRPRFVVVENVSNLFVRGFDRVISGLAAIRYDAEWQIIPASAVGAHHRRNRVWIVAYPSSDLRGASGDGGQETSDRIDSPLADAARNRVESERIPAKRKVSLADADGCSEDAANSQGVRLQRQRAGGQQEPETHGRARIFVCGSRIAGQWSVEPNVGRVANGVPSRVDRLKGLGNAVVPQIAEWIARRILEVANDPS